MGHEEIGIVFGRRWFILLIFATLGIGLALGSCQAIDNGSQPVATRPSEAAVTSAATPSAVSLPVTETIAPLPTVQATPLLGTATPDQLPASPTRPMCTNDLALVLDLNLSDQPSSLSPVLAPGAEFEQGWRVRNTGTCTWDSSYTLAFVGVSEISGRKAVSALPVTGRVKPGEMYEFHVDLIAPIAGGGYQAAWQLQDGSGVSFGETLKTVVQVASITPPAASSGAYFRASRLEIEAGEEVAFTWDVSQSKKAYFYPSGGAWQEHPVPLKGSLFEYPQRTTTYLLRVVNADDSVDVQRIRIEVVPPGIPEVLGFWLTPEDAIKPGECVKINWDTTYHSRSVDLYRNDTLLLQNAAKYGGTQDCPPGYGTVTYKLIVYGVGGMTCRSKKIEIR